MTPLLLGTVNLKKIPLSKECQEEYIHRQIDDISLEIEDLKANNGERFTIKQMEKTKKNLLVRLEKLNDSSKKDDVVTFEQLGIDRLFIDESHNYKNLFLYTKMRNVAGIAQTEAQKSSDLFAKCQYLDELTGSKRDHLSPVPGRPSAIPCRSFIPICGISSMTCFKK